jgi:glucose-1-phosphate cytidylyltransferase
MKVVLFCGGLGLRIREHAESIPKPMVTVGTRPILWHVMRYYAHHGHRDFILCLGYRGDIIKEYFLKYNEAISNDFVLSAGGHVDLIQTDIADWTITCVDTGTNTNIGQRLRAVRPYLGDDEMFLANYSDGLSNLPLPEMIARVQRSNAVAGFTAVRPGGSFHVVSQDPEGYVTSISHLEQSGLRINGGYFVLRQEIFDYLQCGEELVEQPFDRLIAERRLIAYPWDGFWAAMDTFKERQMLEDMYARGETPWMVWRRANGDSKT